MKKILCLICLFSISFYSCAVRNYLSSKSDLNEDRVFYGQMINEGQNAGWFNVPAHLVRNTEHLAIYVQTKFREDYKGEQNVSLYALNKLAQEFDYYYTSMTNIYGIHSDIDGNGKIIILLMDINVNKGAGSQVLGYFNPMDMHGYNEGEILYMDISNANNKTDNAIGTIIHEFQHLINYSYVMSGARNEMDSWLNEALSESTSILFNKATAESRINEFNKINYYCFYTWNAPKQEVAKGDNNKTNTNTNSHFNYPSASVFMNWLYQKNGSNETIFKTIASSKELGDYNKVLSAAKGISGYSVSSWDGLLLDWMSEIVTNGSNWTTTNKPTNNCASGDVSLYPGAMIVCDNYTNGASGNIVTNKVNGKTIVLNKDTTLGKGATSVKVSVSSQASSKARTRRSAIRNDNNEESRDINILLDRNGNIKKD